MELDPRLTITGSEKLFWQPTAGWALGRARTPLAGRGTPRELAGLLQTTAEAQAALENTMVAATAIARSARSLSSVLEEVLAELAASDDDPIRSLSAAPQVPDHLRLLSPREREVLALVAEGQTNRAIAAALYVSPNTVKTHVTSLLHKLRADSRVQLATIAMRYAIHETTI